MLDTSLQNKSKSTSCLHSVDLMNFRSPDVAATSRHGARVNNGGSGGFQSSDRCSTRDLDVRPCRGCQVIIAIVVDDKGVRTIGVFDSNQRAVNMIRTPRGNA